MQFNYLFKIILYYIFSFLFLIVREKDDKIMGNTIHWSINFKFNAYVNIKK